MSRPPELDRQWAKCAICGGTIYEWPSVPGRWFHETVSGDNDPFDIADWLAHPEKKHLGRPVGVA